MSDKLDSLASCSLGVGISSDGKYVVLMLNNARGTNHHYMDRQTAIGIATLIMDASEHLINDSKNEGVKK